MDAVQTIAEWLSRVHPGVGIVGLNAFSRSASTGKPVLVRFPLPDNPDKGTWEQVAWEIVKIDRAAAQARDFSVRVRLASYLPVRSWKRSAVKCSRTWMVDIDAHNGGSTVEEMTSYLLRHVGIARLPMPTFIMATGWGIHGLWCTEEVLDPPAWNTIAQGIRTALRSSGMRWDEEATTDITRTTRPPCTTNWRVESDPRPVSIHQSGPTISAADLPGSPASRSSFPSANDGALAKISSGVVTTPAEYQPWSMETVVENCAVLGGVYRTGGSTCSEPQWRACLQITAFSSDAEKWAHTLSSGHRNYSPEETDGKLATIKQGIKDGTIIGPLHCDKLREIFSEDRSLCSTCKYNGKVRSPAGIPFALRKISAKKVRNSQPGEEPGLYYYEKVAHPPDSSGTEKVTFEWEKIADWEMTEVQLTEPSPEDPNPGPSEIQWRSVFPNKLKRLAKLDLNSLHDSRSVMVAISKAGLPRVFKPASFLAALQDIRDALRAEARIPSINRIGWEQHKGLKGFAFGSTFYTPGENFTGAVGPMVEDEAPLFVAFTPVGRLARWQELMAEICKDKRPSVHAALGMSFGAPLVNFTRMGGLQAALVSPGTGVGKTTILRIAQSVWGPRSMIGTTADTVNAVTRRLSLVPNLPFIRDEFQVSADTFDSLQQIFSIEGGAEKARMSHKTVLFGGQWHTLVILASNDSLSSLLRMSRFGRAGMARMLELDVQPVSEAGIFIEPEMVSEVEDNHGRAAEAMIPYMVERVDKWPELISATRARIATHLGLSEQDDTRAQMRFLLTTAAVTILGGKMAVASKALPWWNERLAAEGLFHALRAIRDELRRQDQSMTVEQLIARFVGEHAALIVTRTGSGKLDVISHVNRHVPPIGEYNMKTGELVLLLSRIEEWAKRHRLPLFRTSSRMQHYLSPTPYAVAEGTSYSIPLSEVIIVPAEAIGYRG